MILCEIVFVTNSILSEIPLINLLKAAKNLPFNALILRENDEYYNKFAPEILSFCKAKNIKFITHSNTKFAIDNGICNIHFSFAKFYQVLKTCPEILSKFSEISVSIHFADELNFAAKNDVKFVILGSVFKTNSHPNKTALGLENFSKTAINSPLPIYAIGGITFENMNTLPKKNIKGVCMMREIYANFENLDFI